MTLFRNMRRDGDRPLLGPKGLHIRRGVDVPQTADDDEVTTDGGGLSTAPGDPMLLPAYRRPHSLGGTSPDPMWSIRREQLPAHELTSRYDHESHETILPARPTTLSAYEESLGNTVAEWTLTHD